MGRQDRYETEEAMQEETGDRNGEKHDKRRKILKEVFNNAVMIMIALGVGFFLNKYVVANAQVPTGSMETTVMAGDRILVNRLSYVFGEPQRGDIDVYLSRRWRNALPETDYGAAGRNHCRKRRPDF